MATRDLCQQVGQFNSFSLSPSYMGGLKCLWSSAHCQRCTLDRARVRGPGLLSLSRAMGRYVYTWPGHRVDSRVRVCLQQGTAKLAVISTQPLSTSPFRPPPAWIASLCYAILCSWNIAGKQTVDCTLSTRSCRPPSPPPSCLRFLLVFLRLICSFPWLPSARLMVAALKSFVGLGDGNRWWMRGCIEWDKA